MSDAGRDIGLCRRHTCCYAYTGGHYGLIRANGNHYANAHGHPNANPYRSSSAYGDAASRPHGHPNANPYRPFSAYGDAASKPHGHPNADGRHGGRVGLREVGDACH